jgi:glutamyl-tRNA synthetase
MTNSNIVTRFAPSPTGYFHLGGIRSALYNYLFARKHGGTFILRCEDTDPARSEKKYEDYFLEVFQWLGIEHDAYYRQSERTAIYREHLEKLIAEGKAYVSKEVPTEEGKRDEVIRFKNPNKAVTFEDQVLGTITFDTTELGDFVIARDLDSPIYHFTVVVDDFLMGITHIIRGQEHVSNTPRQILIQEALGAPRPIYAHGSIILNQERKKLSKRDPSVHPVLDYREAGYLPDALLNFMALLGWNPGTEQEVFSREDLVATFSIERMQKPGAIFSTEKLEWINKEHIKRLPEEELLRLITERLPKSLTELPGFSPERLKIIQPLITERITNFSQVSVMAATGELDYFFTPPTYKAAQLLWKGEGELALITPHLDYVISIFEGISETVWSGEPLKTLIWDYATENGRGQVLWPIRFALSGRDRSPDPFQLASILGKEETLIRLRLAKDLINHA